MFLYKFYNAGNFTMLGQNTVAGKSALHYSKREIDIVSNFGIQYTRYGIGNFKRTGKWCLHHQHARLALVPSANALGFVEAGLIGGMLKLPTLP